MVHALVMSFGWLECGVVVFGTQVGLMARVGALEERTISREHFAIWRFARICSVFVSLTDASLFVRAHDL